MSGISTHVLDTSRGQPARGIRVTLEYQLDDASWNHAGQGVTDANGRVSQLLESSVAVKPGVYRLIFQTGDYFEGQDFFYPEVSLQFVVREPDAHYHVPLLLSPHGYTTYRGS